MAPGKTTENKKNWQAKIWQPFRWLLTLRKVNPVAHSLKISGDIFGQTVEHSFFKWCMHNGFPEYAIYPTELALKAILYLILVKWIIEGVVEAYRHLKLLLLNKPGQPPDLKALSSKKTAPKRRRLRKTPKLLAANNNQKRNRLADNDKKSSNTTV